MAMIATKCIINSPFYNIRFVHIHLPHKSSQMHSATFKTEFKPQYCRAAEQFLPILSTVVLEICFYYCLHDISDESGIKSEKRRGLYLTTTLATNL